MSTGSSEKSLSDLWAAYGHQHVQVGELMPGGVLTITGVEESEEARELAAKHIARGVVTAILQEPGKEPLFQVGQFQPPLVLAGEFVTAVTFRQPELELLDQ